MSNVHFSSKVQTWATPQDFFDALNAEFDFTLDAAASADNAKCAKFFDEAVDGLAQSWEGERVWCNPPYSKVAKWIEKAATEKSLVTVMLIPARTDTKAWHDHIFGKAEARFVRGRLKFGTAKWAAPFPSAVVIFRNS